MASNVDFDSDFDFVKKPSQKYFCPVSFELLLDPVQTSFCCGHRLSRAAAEQLQTKGKPCPMCKKTPLKTTDDLCFKRDVMELKVRCSNKSAGCKWVGELGELDNHLKPGSVEGQCHFVDVECPLQCGRRVKRRNLNHHKSKQCAKRPVACQYCDYRSTYEMVVNDHWPKCQCYPKVCPNNCSTDKIERRFLQHHLKEKCPLEMIPCKFAFAGCGAKIKRESMKKHLDEAKDEHLEILGSECKNLKIQQTNLMLAFTKIFPKPVFIPPPDFIMTDFKSNKGHNDYLFSPDFYTHIGGYKMCLKINNGWGSSKGTHVGVGVYMMKGEFDSHLKWPFKGEITVELVNQKEGGENYERKLVQHTDPDIRDEVFQKVTEGDRAGKGWGIPDFISHSDLYKPEEGKEYLVNDTLIFRVTNVEVTSV